MSRSLRIPGTLACAALLGLCGCPRGASPQPVVAPRADAAPAVEPAPIVDQTLSLRVRITPTLSPAAEIRVAIEVGGPAEADESLRVWTLPGPVAAAIEPKVHDANGAIDVEVEREGEGVRVRLARAPIRPVQIEYAVTQAPALPGRVARVELDEVHFFATGEALLLLPEDALDQRQTLGVEVVADALGPAEPETPTGMPPLRAASSFAARPEVELEGWPFELRRAAFVAGFVEWAQFDSMGGDDRWLGLGPTRFGHRWCAAELAGVRSVIDGSIGMPTLEPLVTILLSASRSASEPGVFAELRGRGLLIVADHSAFWDASARMTATQAIAARWLGGLVRVHEAPDLEHARERALWFDAGVTRFVAREALYPLGLLADEEYAAELNLIELELSSSPLRERSIAELAQLIAAADADPTARLAAADARTLLVARGAMLMAWLDAKLRARPNQFTNDGVTEVLRLLVANAVAGDRRELPVNELLALAARKYDRTAPPEAEFLAAFDSIVVRGERPQLADEPFGPCFRPRTRKVRRFELGFIDSSRVDDERPSFVALDPEGPAARAGLRPDDTLLSLDYVFGDPEREVAIQVARGDAIESIEYLPAGPARRVIQWERVAEVPPEACVR